MAFSIDLRSDTVTRPTPDMLEAMANAEVGDDVFMEDPTINRLQEVAAARMGKEAGLFVPSGTMGNLIAVLVHCGRGDAAIMGTLGHTYLFEAGGVSALGGVFPTIVPNQPDGTLNLEDVEAAIRPNDVHQPVTRLLILENTQNRCGGVVLTPEYTRAAGDLAVRRGLKFHLDGARIFNAAAALGVPAAELTAPVDSVTFCLSKALCAPVGSVLCGSTEFIAAARRVRKQLGGGMRQAGVLAAAGLVALEKMTGLLKEDHRRAKQLAEGLLQIPGMRLTFGFPATNMVFASLQDSVPMDTREVVSALAERGIKIGVVGKRQFRMVTHYWIDDAAVQAVLDGFRSVLVR